MLDQGLNTDLTPREGVTGGMQRTLGNDII